MHSGPPPLPTMLPPLETYAARGGSSRRCGLGRRPAGGHVLEGRGRPAAPEQLAPRSIEGQSITADELRTGRGVWLDDRFGSPQTPSIGRLLLDSANRFSSSCWPAQSRTIASKGSCASLRRWRPTKPWRPVGPTAHRLARYRDFRVWPIAESFCVRPNSRLGLPRRAGPPGSAKNPAFTGGAFSCAGRLSRGLPTIRHTASGAERLV